MIGKYFLFDIHQYARIIRGECNDDGDVVNQTGEQK